MGMSPDSSEIDAELALGDISMSAGDLPAAEESYRRADELGSPEGALLLGVVRRRMGDLPGAKDAYARAEARGHREAASNLGLILADEGDAPGAAAAYARSDALGSANAAMNLGLLRADHGDVAGAVDALTRAEGRGISEAAYFVGNLLEDRGDLWGADAAYTRADAGEMLDATFALGLLALKFEDVTDARTFLTRASERGHERADSTLALIDEAESQMHSEAAEAPARPASEARSHAPGLRSDGLYTSGDETALRCVRFYDDGRVITVSTTPDATLERLAAWFDWSHEQLGRGEIDVDGDQIRFSSTSPEGTVDYSGTILESERMALSSYSHINGYVGPTTVFEFSAVRFSR